MNNCPCWLQPSQAKIRPPRFKPLPTPLDIVIGRATAKNPQERYPDILSMLVDIRRAMQPQSTVADVLTTQNEHTPPHIAAMIDLPDLENPYKGLRAFSEADSADFFGRDTLVQALLVRMAEDNDLSRFLAVIGPSGSGKSSVVRAGLLPSLRQGGLPNSEKWFVVDMIPGPHPLEELEAALLRVAINPPDSLLGQLQADERGLLRAVQRILPTDEDVELVLLIDQFEEIFTLVSDEDRRVHFLNSLLTAILDPRSRVRVLLTMRADFTDRPLQYVDFGELLRQQSEFVLPLTPDELEQAIIGPTKRAGLMLESGLISTIIDDIGDQPGMLPLLQYALTELFERRDGRKLTLSAYQASGGVLGALARRADELYGGLSQAEQEAARQLFLRLVTLGEGAEDTRRRVLRSELENLQASSTSDEEIGFEREDQPSPNPSQREGNSTSPLVGKIEGGLMLGNDTSLSSQAKPAKVLMLDSLIKQFGKYRLLTFDHDPISRGPTVEVAHEALLREWGQLRTWLAESRDDIRLQRLLASAAYEWEEAEHDFGFLLRGSRLSQFETWAENSHIALTKNENAYLEASLSARQVRQEAEEARLQRELETAQKLVQEAEARLQAEEQHTQEQTQAARRLRWLSICLALFLVLALGASIWATQERQEANTQRQLALSAEATAAAERDIAVSRQLAIQAEDELDSNNFDTALLLAIEAARTAETLESWHILRQALSQPRPLQLTLEGHTGPLSDFNGAAWSPDGSQILTTSWDETARIWDAETGQPLFVFSGHTDGFVHGAVWNKAGTRVLTASDDDTARVWDTEKGTELLKLPAKGNVELASWSPDESRIMAIDYDDGSADLIHIWDAETGQDLLTLRGHTFIQEVRWNTDGTRIISNSSDKTARVWDASSGEELMVFSGHEDGVIQARWSPDEGRILTASVDGVVKVWDAETGQEMLSFPAHSSFLWTAIWNGDGSRIMTTSDDGTAKVWDAKTGQNLLTLTGHTDTVKPARWNKAESLIVTASEDNTARLWDAETGQELARFGHSKSVTSVSWSPDERFILTASDDHTARIWAWGANSGETNPELPVLIGSAIEYYQASWSGDEKLILTASADPRGYARIWDAETGQEHLTFVGHIHNVYRAVWNKDESRVLTASADGTARVWDAQTGAELLMLSGHADEVNWAIWNKAESRILTNSDDGTAWVWDAETGQVLLKLIGHSAAVNFFSESGAGWNNDESRILTASLDGTVRVWDAQTGVELMTLSGHTDEVHQAIWNADSSLILTRSKDGTARVWDAQSGEGLLTLNHPDEVTVAHWSQDEKRILTADYDGLIHIWDAETGAELLTLTSQEILEIPVYQARWNSDESQILATSGDGTLRLWNVETKTERLIINPRAGSDYAIWNQDESRILLTGNGRVEQYYTRLEDLMAVGCERLNRNFSQAEWTEFFDKKAYQATCPDLPTWER